MLMISNGKTFDYDRTYVKQLCKELVKLDKVGLKNIDARNKRHLEKLCRRNEWYFKKLISEVLDYCEEHNIYDIVLEDLELFSGSYVKTEPADKPDYDLTIDFCSHVLGVQNAHWDPEMDYISQIAPCRTFCFFHEVEFLLANNLIKGGDIYNAIVVVERPISGEQLQMVRDRFEMQELDVTPKGYLNNIKLHFPNECGRHKMLDLIGDLRLCGGFLNAKVTAYKSGHTINTAAAKAIEKAIGLK